MAVTERDGKILVFCHSGCTQDAVLNALGLRDRTGRRPSTPRIANHPKPDTTGTEARAQRAVRLFTPAPNNHPYLVKKSIQAHGVGVLGEQYRDLPAPVKNRGNVLVIPMQNVHGKILSCQFVTGDGAKAFLAGPKRSGGFFFIRGNGRIWVCEGFATGASLHEATGDTVVVAFDTGGLMPVVGALTSLYGAQRQIVIMSDDDWATDNNPGMTKALEASRAHGVKATKPDFSGLIRGPKDTDYNDLVRLRDAR